MPMRAVIVANGELDADENMVREWESAELRIAADGGANNAREHLTAPPEIIIGDMDSLDNATDKWITENGIERIKYPRAKDKTDLELAVDLAQARNADQVRVFGALGGRLDHEIANVFLLSRMECIFEDKKYEIRSLSAGSGPAELVVSGTVGETVSLIPTSDSVIGIEIDGFAYPLANETLTRGTTRGVSNVLIEPSGRIRISAGQLLVIRLKSQAQTRPV